MITTDVLLCGVCRKEVRIVRLTPNVLGLGHVTNPRQNHHAVRLARPVAENAINPRNPQRQLEGPEKAPDAAGGPSPERTAQAGARRPSALSVSLPSGERALQTGSPVGSPRPPLTAGRRPT